MGLEALRDRLREEFGGEKVKFSFADREHKEFVHEFWVDVHSLAESVIANSALAIFIPLLPEITEEPYEIWQVFEENVETGQVRLRHHFVKALELEQGQFGFALIFEADEGINASVEFLVFGGAKLSEGLNQFRVGKLIYARDA